MWLYPLFMISMSSFSSASHPELSKFCIYYGVVSLPEKAVETNEAYLMHEKNNVSTAYRQEKQAAGLLPYNKPSSYHSRITARQSSFFSK